MTEREKRRLSDRLKAVADMVTAGNRVCDVGCDHGYVCIYLVEHKICPGAIAMDIKEGPLKAAGRHIREKGLGEYIRTRLSDGVAALAPGEAETLILSGMGGGLIMRILEEGREKAAGMRELILSPQSETGEVRRFLRREGFAIREENMVLEEGKFYPIIRAVPCPEGGGCSPTETGEERRLEDEYGPVLLRRRHPVLRLYLERELGIGRKIQMELAGRGEPGERKERKLREVEGRIALAQRGLLRYEDGEVSERRKRTGGGEDEM